MTARGRRAAREARLLACLTPSPQLLTVAVPERPLPRGVRVFVMEDTALLDPTELWDLEP